jgi:predicted lipoprotein
MNRKKILWWIGGILLIGVVIKLSIYVEPLEEHRKALLMKQFSPDELVNYHWQHDLNRLLREAVPVEAWLAGMRQQPQAFSKAHAQVPGIGAHPIFIIQGKGVITQIEEQRLVIQLTTGLKGIIQTAYLFSNTARDATGWFDPDQFQNTMDYNQVSSCLNLRIREEVIKPILSVVKKGARVFYCGALEVNLEEAFPPVSVELDPFRLEKSTN